MNNLFSYCGLVDAKIRASDKDLPVQVLFHYYAKINRYVNEKLINEQKKVVAGSGIRTRDLLHA